MKVRSQYSCMAALLASVAFNGCSISRIPEGEGELEAPQVSPIECSRDGIEAFFDGSGEFSKIRVLELTNFDGDLMIENEVLVAKASAYTINHFVDSKRSLDESQVGEIAKLADSVKSEFIANQFTQDESFLASDLNRTNTLIWLISGEAYCISTLNIEQRLAIEDNEIIEIADNRFTRVFRRFRRILTSP